MALVVQGDDEDKKALLELYHDVPTAGHTGVTKTLQALCCDYWWLDITRFIQAYMKGCAQCQENKTITHCNIPPVQPITPQPAAQLFSTIAMDFVVKLPKSHRYDSILTITDHDCTKAIILLPCREDMDSTEFTRLYLE
jgi:hypothetical protein